MIGACERFIAFKEKLRAAARWNEDPTLLVGERGSGKELAARALHLWSPRCNEIFLAVSMPALHHDLIADELFGHERSSFTGATDARLGAFAAAERGTLFLDEIAEILPGTQAALLRAIESGEIKPIGGDAPRKVNVRIVAATNRDVTKLIKAGKFRPDLYDRLSVLKIPVPPLRERMEDIPALASHFLRHCCARSGCALGRTDRGPCQGRQKVDCALEGFYQGLKSYEWQGNVRELRSAVIGIRVRHPKDRLDASHLAELTGRNPLRCGRDLTLETLIRRHIGEVLRLAGNNFSAAAKELGVPRSTLRNMLKRYGIKHLTLIGRR